MYVSLEYEEQEYLKINTISVIGKFNNYDPIKGKMVKENSKWVFKCQLPPGEHPYKFLINENLKLNDSKANIYMPDDNEELWSIVMINDEDERLYNNTQYTVHIDKYSICSNIGEDVNLANKKSFNTLLDKKVVTRFNFTNITGLHSVTTAWYTPKGELFQTSENSLFASEDVDKPVMIWFWMDLENKKGMYPLGLWSIKLFVDGEFVLEDKFELLEGMAYSSKGKIKY